MICDDVTPLLSPFLDGELGPRDEAAVRVHLARCDRCAGRLDALQVMRSAVRSTRPEPSDEGLEALRRRILRDRAPGPRPPVRRRGLWTGLAAGLAIVAAGSVWLSVDRHGPERTPPGASARTSLSPDATMPEADLSDPATPCARPEECGQGAREIWPALPI